MRVISPLVIDDNSSCKFTNSDKSFFVTKGLKITKKETIIIYSIIGDGMKIL